MKIPSIRTPPLCYLVVVLILCTVVGVAAVAQDGAAVVPPGGVVLRPDDITHLGGLGVQGVLGWQAILQVQRAIDLFSRAVTAAEAFVAQGAKVDAGVGDLADAVRAHAPNRPAH